MVNPRTLLICNDEARGHALGQMCRFNGIDAPGWCVVWGDDVMGIVDSAEIFIVAGVDAGRTTNLDLARSIAWRATGTSVIFVGELEEAAAEPFRIVAPDDDWPARAVEALIDLLGLTPSLLPNYENRLRVLGRELDQLGYRLASIEETEDGFRIQPEADSEAPQLPIHFGSREFGRLARAFRASRGEAGWERPSDQLAVAGHERLLRYLGSTLDRRGAGQVRIVTLAHSLVVSGYESDSPYTRPQPFQQLYRPSELRLLQQQGAHGRRKVEGWLDRLMRRFGVSS